MVADIWRSMASKYNLIGLKCQKCGSLQFPPKGFCKCGSTDFESYRFSGNGKIVSYTIIRVPPQNFEKVAPYGIAIIELDEGPRTMGQIVKEDLEKMKIGARVKAVFRKISEDGQTGVINYGYKFEILD